MVFVGVIFSFQMLSHILFLYLFILLLYIGGLIFYKWVNEKKIVFR